MKDKGIDNALLRDIDTEKPSFKGFQSIRKLFWKYLNLLGVPFSDPCCPSASTVPSGGGSLLSATVELTDEQIKTLPTIPVEIVAPQGLGKVIVPIIGIVEIDASGGAYTGVTDSSLVLHDGNINYLSSITRTETQLGIGFSTPQTVEIACPFMQVGTGTFDTLVLSTQTFQTSSMDNQPLQVSDSYAGIGNYGGGNAANTLRVTVYYVVINI